MERINKTTTGCANCDYYFGGECTYYKTCHRVGLPNLNQNKNSYILDNDKLILAKDYLTKALKLIEELDQKKDGKEE